jgi:Ca-activated chloride channel family protein
MRPRQVQLLLTIALGATLLLLTFIWGCDSKTTETPRGPTQSTVVKIVHSPELADFLNQARDRFHQGSPRLTDGSKVVVEFLQEPSLNAATKIANGEIKVDGWITPSSSLVNLVNYKIVNLGQKQINCTPLFSTPVVLAVGAQNAKLISPTREFDWNSIFERRGAPIPQSNTTENGQASQISYSHAQPSTSSEGLASYLQLAYWALSQGNTDLTRDAINSKAALDRLRAYEEGVSTFGPFDDQLLRKAARTEADRIGLVLTTEQRVALFNSTNPDTPIAALYPKDGSFLQDYRLCVSEADWVGPAQRKALEMFLKSLLSKPSQFAVKQLGFRPEVQIEEEALLSRRFGIDTHYPKNFLPPVAGNTVEYLVNKWPSLKGSSVTVVVVDASGSMEGLRIDVVKQLLRPFFAGISDGDMAGLIVFNSEPEVLVEVSTDAGAAVRATDTIKALGGSAVYDAISLAFQRLSRENLKSHRKSVLLITDGNDKNSDLTLESLASRLQRREAEEDIQLVILGIENEETNFADLESLATRARGVFRKGSIDNLPSIFAEVQKSF